MSSEKVQVETEQKQNNQQTQIQQSPENVSIKNIQQTQQGQQKTQNPPESEKDVTDKEQKQKMVTIPKKELLAWHKKSNKMKAQNDALRQQLQNACKKLEERRKNQSLITGMQQTIKQLQKMLEQSVKNEEKATRQYEKLRDVEKVQRDMNKQYQQQIQGLRNISAQYFLLKQEISRLSMECKALKQAKQKYPTLVKNLQLLKHQMQIHKQEIQTKNKQIEKLKQINEKLEKKVSTIIEEKNTLTRQFQQLESQKEQCMGQVDALMNEIQDTKTEQQVSLKRYQNQIKQLKIALHQEHEKFVLSEAQIKQLQQRSNRKKFIDLDKIPMADLSKDDLFNMLEEAEMKNATLKLSLNELTTNYQQINRKFLEKQAAVVALVRQMLKTIPTLEQSQGLDYVEKDIIQIGLEKKDDWGQIIEKVMLQNLRLKQSVTQLGQEYNQIRREQKLIQSKQK